MTESEELMSAFSQLYFFEEFVHDNLLFTPAESTERELSDLILNLDDCIVAIQIKERTRCPATNDAEREKMWLENRLSDAKKQIAKTVQFIREGKLPSFQNKRGQYIRFRPDAKIIPLVVFLNEVVTDYPHILLKHTAEGLDVNCMSLKDFQIMCKTLVSPGEIVDYLEYRLSFYEKYGPVDTMLMFVSETDCMISRPTSNEVLVQQYVAERYGLQNVVKRDGQMERFRWFMQESASRSITGRDSKETYLILLFLAHFRRDEIVAFMDRLLLARDKAKEKDYDIVGSIRTETYVVFFVASQAGEAFQMDYLLDLAREKCNPQRLLQVYVWWEDDENYRIDYLLWDSTLSSEE